MTALYAMHVGDTQKNQPLSIFANGNRIVTFPLRRERSQRSDSASSLITELEAGRDVSLGAPEAELSS